MKLQYDFPATDWEKEALPLGNERIGAMVFGGIKTDVIFECCEIDYRPTFERKGRHSITDGF